MTVERDNRYAAGGDEHWPIIELAMNAAAKRICPDINPHVCVVLTSDEEIRQINLETRGKDAATDVLSFPALRLRGPVNPQKLRRAPRDPDSGGVALGDVVISLDRAKEQANEYGHSLGRELSFLSVHAVLHLLGYDHMQGDDKAAMRLEEEAILSSIGQARDALISNEELVSRAIAARKNAYAPYSGYAVGASLLAFNGRVFEGVNVENASYGITICAERSAICAAVTAGAREFAAIAVAAETPPFPCGACRQALAEFSPDIIVLVATPDGSYTEHKLSELLPHSFAIK